MCGLVGAAGDTTGKIKDIFTDLLIIDSLRGNHSTGVAAVRRWKSEIELAKEVGGPHNLITTKAYRDALNPPVKALIGHNRHATMGKHTVENAHPFMFDGVVGAHNGTLDKWAVQNLHDYEKFDTDSEAIFATIADRGLRKTVDELDGAWALTWFDTNTNTINMLRNDKRPLFYTYSKDRQTLLWASEDVFLELVFDRYKKEFADDKIYSLPVDMHLSWTIPEAWKEFTQPTGLEMKAPIKTHSGGWYGADGFDWKAYQKSMGGGGKGKSNVTPFVGSSPSQKSTGSQTTSGKSTCDGSSTLMGRHFDKPLTKKKFRPPYKDTNGKIINKVDFTKLTTQGCAFCGTSDVPWGKFIKPFFDSRGTSTFLCESCYRNDDTREICKHLI